MRMIKQFVFLGLTDSAQMSIREDKISIMTGIFSVKSDI